MLLPILIAALVGYLLGSLPFGCIVARAKGVNIFEVGSRSPGATNVRRVLGKGPGNLVFALDVLKGALAASWALLAAAPEVLPMRWETWAGGALVGDKAVALGVAGLVGALFGHSFSCFTRFRVAHRCFIFNNNAHEIAFMHVAKATRGFLLAAVETHLAGF